MAVESLCRAKDPSRCWKHGTQLGTVADEHIRRSLANPDLKYYLSEEERASAPLKKLTATGLALAIADHAKNNPELDEIRIQNAILLASRLHKEDQRSNRGRYDNTPYIEHPLRNTLRAIRYGNANETQIIGCLLHDTVEDHPFEISRDFYGVEAKTEEEARENSFKYIKRAYGEDVSRMVRGMSNPIIENKYMPAAEKNKIYADHVKEAIEDPDVCVGKVCDFVDNAVGLFHNQKGGMSAISLQKKARKYLPVCDILEERLKRAKDEPNFPMDSKAIDHMLRHINDGRQSLIKLLG